MKSKSGFTLAEVLITLVIIGVIAAMTIPTLMQNTQSQEYKSALKKAVSSINQAIAMQYAVDSTTLADFKTNATTALTAVFMQRLNVIETATTGAIGGYTRYSVFYTADGMKFGFDRSATFPTCDSDGTGRCWHLVIDVNGDKGPNKITTDVNAPKDVYLVLLYSNRAVPCNDGTVTQEIMYGN